MGADLPHGQAAWRLAGRQHGVIARRQLLALGFTPKAIRHRLSKGRLHVLWPGVYAVGRPDVPQEGRWLAAVLACEPHSVLSHRGAGALWRMVDAVDWIDVSIPAARARRPREGIVIHRRRGEIQRAERNGIPVTPPVDTLVDLAAVLPAKDLPWAIRQADVHSLVAPPALRRAIDGDRRPGAATLRALLDRETFRLTDSQLEDAFLPLAAKAGLPIPETGKRPHGYKIDFFWPQLRLVVETDSLTYHRTPTQQIRDRRRDQVHAARA